MAPTNGYGIQTYDGGDKYEGDFKDGVKHGTGRYTWANGRVYEGDWRDGKRHGSGVYKNVLGVKFKQEWQDDMLLSETIDGEALAGKVMKGAASCVAMSVGRSILKGNNRRGYDPSRDPFSPYFNPFSGPRW